MTEQGIGVPDGSPDGDVSAEARIRELEQTVERLQQDIRAMDASAQRNQADMHAAYRKLQQEIGDREHIEARLRDAMIRAEEANLAKARFLGNMSHEIRTPMAAILGFADLLGEPEIDEDERQECVRTIRKNGEHLLAMLNDVLDLAHLELGDAALEEIDFSPAQVLTEVAFATRARAIEKRLDLLVEYASPVPERIRADPVRLRQILVNIVDNALKFTQRGSVRIVVECDPPARLNSQLRFSVIDTGIGVEFDHTERVFDAFSQADASTTRAFSGSGLGLAVSRRFANLLGGDISVESTPGRGSTFTLSIATGPLVGVRMVRHPFAPRPAWDPPAPLPGEAPEVEKRDEDPREGASAPGRVLLADDGGDNRRVIAFHLENAGYRVQVTDDGQAAYDVAIAAERAGAPFDVVLMDMQMPVLDGYEATRRLRSAGYTGPIVALTAHSMEGDRERCIETGCSDYAAKPIKRDELLKVVARQVSPATPPPVG